ncbi:MAG: hypothetical protein IOC34_04565, partial [Burkholderia sp.]|nr:hypothetical protein [Burkholderia sp.]
MSDRPCHRGPRVPVAALAMLCGVAFGAPPVLAAPQDDATAMPPAQSPDVATVITPRPRDESTFVRVSADGLPDGVSLAEFTPDDTNRPPLPDAVVTHVQAPKETHTELSLGYSSAHLTHGYGDWYGVHLRGVYQDSGRTVLGELAQLHR